MKMFKKYFRYLALITSVLLSISFTPQLANAADIPSRFEFRGAGYGHGVGMSQIGAYGQALEGKSASEIVSYYYQERL